jgi:putative flippase GtrA
MSVLPITRTTPATRVWAPDVEIVVPVYNEADQLAASITTLRSYLDTSFPFLTTVTIADNASTDGTWLVASQLASALHGVEAVHLGAKGRGRALRATWSRSNAPVVAYMDVDLATGLDALLPLVAPLLSGHSDVAIGTRIGPGAHVVRGARREMISRCYNLLLRSVLASKCTDAQCGFKAMRREVAAQVLPLVEDEEWFFDTEILVNARRAGLRIHEVPVDWVDDLDSRVEVLQTALADLRGVWRMLGRHPERRRSSNAPSLSPIDAIVGPTPTGSPTGITVGAAHGPDRNSVPADELFRFAGVGVISTAASAAMFAMLEPVLGGYSANAVAIVTCSLANAAAHHGMAGSFCGRLDRRHRLITAGALTAVSLAFTTGALAVTRAAGFRSLLPALCAVTAGNLAASVVRFSILRTWVFRPRFGTHLEVVEPTDSAAPGVGTATTSARSNG